MASPRPDVGRGQHHRLEVLRASAALASARVVHQLDDLRRLLASHRAVHEVADLLHQMDAAPSEKKMVYQLLDRGESSA